MVDSIKGPGPHKIVLIKTHNKPKTEKTKESQEDFEKTLKGKTGSSSAGGIDRFTPSPAKSSSEHRLTLFANQHLSRMQRLAEIAQQVQNGTYKIVDPYVLAERLVEIFSDKKTRDKFIKKFLAEERENISSKQQTLSPLELKKIIQLVRDSQDVTFDDPELENFLKDAT